MEKVVYLFNGKKDIELLDVTSLLIPVKGLSTRSVFALSIDEIKEIKSKTNKEIYLLCDAIILESEREKIGEIFPILKELADKIFFSDVVFYMEALKFNCLDKMVFYSPTFALSVEDINSWKKLGIKNIIISKESEYDGYIDILKSVNDIDLGMLALGYPQIYYSRRQMLTSFKKEYNHIDFDIDLNLTIKERTRDMKMPIYEDERGTFIFAGEVFFANEKLKELKDLGMKYFIIDPIFINDECDLVQIVKDGLNGIDSSNKIKEDTSSFMLFREMVNNYDK